LQPDAGDGANVIGELWDHVPLSTDGSPNHFDAAIARLDSPWNNRAINEICGQPAVTSVGAAAPGTPVAKFGAKSYATEGRIHSIDYCGQVSFSGIGLVYLEGQLLVHPQQQGDNFCGPGDSGSLLVDPSGAIAFGLVCARAVDSESGGSFGIVTPILPIFEHFRLSLA
jgi:hypothetical protein